MPGIYLDYGAPIEKLILLTMVVDRSGSKGSSASSRNGLSNRNSSAIYPAVVPFKNVTIGPPSLSFSTFNMRVLSVMAEGIPQCQFFDCSILHILVCIFLVRSRRLAQVSGAARGLAVGLAGYRKGLWNSAMSSGRARAAVECTGKARTGAG